MGIMVAVTGKIKNRSMLKGRGHSLPAGLLAIAVLGMALAGCGASSIVVTPSQVGSILKTYSAANNRSNAHLSAADQALDEAGSALAMDNAQFRIAKATGTKPGPPFTFTALASSVPEQLSYPAYFVTLATTARAQAGCGNLLAFERQNSGAPWKVIYEPGVTVNEVPPFLKSGQWGLLSAGGGLSTPLSALPEAVASALARGENSGNFYPIPTPPASPPANACFAIPNNHVTDQNLGSQYRFSFAVKPETPLNGIAIANRNGGATVELTLTMTVNVAISGGYVTIAPNPSSPWTYFLKPGDYSHLQLLYPIELALVDPPAGHGPWKVVGAYSTITAATGTTVSPSGAGSGAGSGNTLLSLLH